LLCFIFFSLPAPLFSSYFILFFFLFCAACSARKGCKTHRSAPNRPLLPTVREKSALMDNAIDAEVDARAVAGRNKKTFNDARKDIATLLAQLRLFFLLIGKPKGSENGLQTTCLEIEVKFPTILDQTNELESQLKLAKEQADLCALSSGADQTCRRAYARFCKRLDEVIFYVQYFADKLQNGDAKKRRRRRSRNSSKSATKSTLVRDAALRAIKHRDTIIGLIDKAAASNKEFSKRVTQFLSSAEFASLARDPDSAVAVRVGELVGSKAGKRALLERMDADLLDEQRRERQELRALIANDVDDETGAPRAYATTAADGRGGGGGDDDDNAEDDILDELLGEDALNGDVVQNDDDVRSDELEDSDDEESDDEVDSDAADGEASEVSEGGALFESNLAEINADVLREAQANAEVRNGRSMRKRKRTPATGALRDDEEYSLSAADDDDDS